MSVRDEYVANYERIAADHAWHWRMHRGMNPFQDNGVVRANEAVTLALIDKYVPHGCRLLDAGCGLGDLLTRLSHYETQGVEIAEPYLEIARDRGLNVTKALIEEMPFPDDLFDAVVATDVLEHVIDLHAATKELLRVLKPGGHFIARVPNDEEPNWVEEQKYPFVHLRTLNGGTVWMLLHRIFGCDVLEMNIEGDVLHIAAIKGAAT